MNKVLNIKQSTEPYQIATCNDRTLQLIALQSKDISEDSIYTKLLTKWRNLHFQSFFTWVQLDKKSTFHWLKVTYDNSPSDLMFFIQDEKKNLLGCMAVYNITNHSCEIGRIMKTDGSTPKGCMTISLKCMVDWIYSLLNMQEIYLEVFEDNFSAIKLYERCGFVETNKIALKVEVSNNIKTFQHINSESEQATPDAYALKMVHKRSYIKR